MANNKVKFGMGILSILQKMATCFIVVLPLLCGCGNETKQIENQHEIIEAAKKYSDFSAEI